MTTDSRRRSNIIALVVAALALAGVACARSKPAVTLTSPLSPRLAVGQRLFITPNPYNVLSSVATVDAREFDSVRVKYWTAKEPERTTPFQRTPGVAQIAVLGLRASTPYSYVMEGMRAGRLTRSDTVQARTGDLPEFLKPMHMRITGRPTGGYVLTSVADTGRTSYVVAFDSTGVLSWYREFPGELPAGETKQHPNGDFTAFVGRTPGWMAFPGFYHQFRPSGEIVRTITAPPPLFADNHELVLTFRDTVFDAAHFFSYDLRPVDLSKWGGPDTLVAGHQLLRIKADGAVETVLEGWDHFSWADRIEPPRDTLWDFDHPNSLDFDHDSNYIVSYRNMGEVTKIDRRTGAIIWRFGGRNNQFKIRNDPLGGFSAQHTARILPNGNLLLYDNGTRHVPQQTRAVEYRLDTRAKTADMVWEYRHNPLRYVPFTGAVQRLASGNTLIAYSNYGTVTEVDPRGQVVWEGTVMRSEGDAGDFYRAIKIASLYRYENP
jgi:hypothetical protein